MPLSEEDSALILQHQTRVKSKGTVAEALNASDLLISENEILSLSENTSDYRNQMRELKKESQLASLKKRENKRTRQQGLPSGYRAGLNESQRSIQHVTDISRNDVLNEIGTLENILNSSEPNMNPSELAWDLVAKILD